MRHITHYTCILDLDYKLTTDCAVVETHDEPTYNTMEREAWSSSSIVPPSAFHLLLVSPQFVCVL